MIGFHLLASTVVFLLLALIGGFYLFMGWCQWTQPDPNGGAEILVAGAALLTFAFAALFLSGAIACFAHFWS